MDLKALYRVFIVAVVLVLLQVSGARLAFGQPASQQESTSAVDGWSKAMELVHHGEFDKGLNQLVEVFPSAQDYPVVERAVELLREYVELSGQAESQRQAEYETSVGRIHRAMLSQRHLPALKQAGTDVLLRNELEDVAAAYNKAATSESLLKAEDSQIPSLRVDTVAALGEAISILKQAEEKVRDDKSDYGVEFGRVVEQLTGRLEAYRQQWAAIDTDSMQDRVECVKRFKDMEEGVSDAMADLETMIVTKPWQLALFHARLAKTLTPRGVELSDEEWFDEFIKDVQSRCEDALADAEWKDALIGYAGLEDLLTDQEQYRQKVKQVRRHVRVLQLYGRSDDSKNESPGPEPSDLHEPSDEQESQDQDWQELVRGIDADMVEKAVAQLDGYYVAPVDYRKLARSALLSVKILAETPQASSSFPLLADQEQRNDFLRQVDQQLKDVEVRERVDHLDLVLALNGVLYASDRTVKLPTEVLCMEFADGFLEELDEFSSMIWPWSFEDFRKQTMGQFFGVGIQINKEPGEPLRVVTPLPDTPAFAAGIKPDDQIVAVDGRVTNDLAIDKLIRMITGEKGTKVVLTIKRNGRLAPFDVELVRDEIRIRTVKGWTPHPDGSYDYLIDPRERIGYIRISQFTDTTADDLDRVLKDLKSQGIDSLVLDLRFNPGGMLRSATDVVDEFLAGGKIVSTRGRQTPRTEISAGTRGRFQGGDMVVLINQVTASAAEIVSGAVKDHKRAIIIGDRSFGKGSVQNVITIRRDRAILKLTTAYYYLPSGRLLHRNPGQKDWGVDPDITVQPTPKQLKRWLDIRQKADLLQEIDPSLLAEDMNRQLQADVSLNTALLMLRIMRLERAGVPESQQVSSSE